MSDIPIAFNKPQFACGDRQLEFFGQAHERINLLRRGSPISSRESDIPFD
jgi:hypothetical protein